MAADQIDQDLDKPTFILCNSNAMFYQQMIHISHTYYLKLFLDRDINVLIWNYRAYGRSSGTPSPENLKGDIITVFKYLREQIGVRGKIGIYGRSLGGIPTSFIARQADMVIIDRSFSSLSQMAIHLFNGTIAEKLLKFGSCGW